MYQQVIYRFLSKSSLMLDLAGNNMLHQMFSFPSWQLASWQLFSFRISWMLLHSPSDKVCKHFGQLTPSHFCQHKPTMWRWRFRFSSMGTICRNSKRFKRNHMENCNNLQYLYSMLIAIRRKGICRMSFHFVDQL